MFKKSLIVIGIILLVFLIAGGILMLRLNCMANSLKSEVAKLSTLDLSKIKDGVYSGSYGNFVVSANLEVTIKNHKIIKIAIKNQSCAKGYEAQATIDRIIKTQSPKVDTVTGASSSSRSIMIAVDRALKNK